MYTKNKGLRRLFKSLLAVSLGCSFAIFGLLVITPPSAASSDELSLNAEVDRPSSVNELSEGDIVSAPFISVTYKQITDTPFGYGFFEPSISADGSMIAFGGVYDFAGENGAGRNEIFLYDATTEVFTQLTHSPVGHSKMPFITPDGQQVVFVSNNDHNGNNSDYSEELWIVDVRSGNIRQLTDTDDLIGSTINHPQLSGDGKYVVFTTYRDPLGTNPNRRLQLFRLNVTEDNPIPEQLTFLTLSTAQAPAVDYDGSRIAFTSNFDFDGSNPDYRSQAWLWDETTGIRAITHETLSSRRFPSIDHSGNLVSFVSFPNGRPELLLANIDDGTIEQLTFAPEQFQSGIQEPVMSPDGSYILFESGRNETGENPSNRRQLFMFDLVRHELRQITYNGQGGGLSDRAEVNFVDISATGDHIVYRTSELLDPSKSFNNNIELFLGGSSWAWWRPQIWINSNGPCLAADQPFNVDPNDVVEVVDRVWLNHTENLPITLAENRGPSLDTIGWNSGGMGSFITATNAMTWSMPIAPPETWYAITKTYQISAFTGFESFIVETLDVPGLRSQPDPMNLMFTSLPLAPSFEVKQEAQLALDWTPLSASCTYNLYESDTPYFDLSTITYPNIDSGMAISDRVGSANNYFYKMQADCICVTTDSTEMGVFNFSLESGP